MLTSEQSLDRVGTLRSTRVKHTTCWHIVEKRLALCGSAHIVHCQQKAFVGNNEISFIALVVIESIVRYFYDPTILILFSVYFNSLYK